MKNLNRIFVIVLSIVVVQLCGGVVFAQSILQCSGNETADPPVSDLLLATGQIANFVVDYDAGQCFWKVTGTDSDWITIDTYSWIAGDDKTDTGDDDSVIYSVSLNNGFQRTGTISVDEQQVHTVVQAGECSITPDQFNLPSAADRVYVAYPVCGSIVRVDQDGAVPVIIDPDSSYEGLVYGPDSRPHLLSEPFDVLYALDPSNWLIDRFVITADGYIKNNIYGLQGFSPRFAGFNQFGDMLVTGSDSNFPGVYFFKNTIPIEQGIQFDLAPTRIWVGGNGESLGGLEFDADGDLLVVNQTRGEVLRFAFDAQNRSYGSPVPIVDSLNQPLGNARAANRDVFVAAGNSLLRFDKDGGPAPPANNICAQFAGETFISVEASANDTLHVTTINNSTNVGHLWEVPFGYNPCENEFSFFCGGARNLAEFGGRTGSNLPPTIVDVALPFTGREPYTDTPACPTSGYEGPPIQGAKGRLLNGVQGWNFFDAFVEFKPLAADAQNCTVTISSQEYGPTEINDVIINPLNTLTPSRPLVLPGDDGRMRVFDFMADDLNECPAGDALDDPRYERAVSAFFTRVNPKLALCHTAGLADCNLQQLKTLDLEFGIIPGDGRLGGVDPKFSEAFLVDQVPVGDYDGTWCGVQSPVSNVEPWLEANGGSVVPIDIKPVLAVDECGDKTIPNLAAVLTVYNADTGIEVPFEDLIFTGNGSASEFRAQFHAGQNPKKPYSLNWNTVDRYGDPLADGLYKLNIIDDSAATNGTSDIYFPPQTVYVILK